MKNLELNQMESVKGSGDTRTILCGAGIGMLFGGATAIAGCFLILLTCTQSDSN